MHINIHISDSASYSVFHNGVLVITSQIALRALKSAYQTQLSEYNHISPITTRNELTFTFLTILRL